MRITDLGIAARSMATAAFCPGRDRGEHMDDCRFDNWTRMLGRLQARRAALKEMAGAGAALFSLAKLDLGLVQAQDVGIAAGGCKVPGASCSRPGDCCANKCSNRSKRECSKKKGKKKKKKCKNVNVDGVCGCIDKGNNGCGGRDAACCNGFCDGDTCRCVGASGRCNVKDDCCDGRDCIDDGTNTGRKFCKSRSDNS
jgi:hypothetical protein